MEDKKDLELEEYEEEYEEEGFFSRFGGYLVYPLAIIILIALGFTIFKIYGKNLKNYTKDNMENRNIIVESINTVNDHRKEVNNTIAALKEDVEKFNDKKLSSEQYEKSLLNFKEQLDKIDDGFNNLELAEECHDYVKLVRSNLDIMADIINVDIKYANSKDEKYLTDHKNGMDKLAENQKLVDKELENITSKYNIKIK